MKNKDKLILKLSLAIFATLSMAFRCGSDPEPEPTDSGFVPYDSGTHDDGGTTMVGTVQPMFVAPGDHSEVENGTVFEFAVMGARIIPQTEIVDFGEGFFVLAIDASCTLPNEVVPRDPRHLHLVNGEKEIAIFLAEGMHVFCLQVAFVDGRAYDGRARLSVYMY